MLSKLLAVGTPKSPKLWLGLSLSGLEALAAIALLSVSAWLISAAAEQPAILYLNEAIVGVRGFALGRAFFRYTQRLALHDAAFSQLSKVRPALFKKLAPMAPAGMALFDRGDFAARAVQDTDELQNLTLRVFPPILQSLVVSATAVVGLAILTPSISPLWLALILLVTAFVGLSVSSGVSKRQAELAATTRALLNKEISGFVENFDVISSYGWSDTKLTAVGLRQNAVYQLVKRESLAAGLAGSLFGAGSTVAVVTLAFLSGNSASHGLLDHRLLAVLVLAPLAIFDVWSNLQSVPAAWQKYRGSANRIAEVLSMPGSEGTDSGRVHLQAVDQIHLNRATFTYPGKTKGTEPVTVTIASGDFIAIMGDSGAGKTTLAYGLSGLMPPSSGEVLLNNVPIECFSETDLRKRIGYLEQNPTIFDGPLRANLAIGKPDASDAELWQALADVGLSQLFEARNGLDTELGDRGFALSGGEAQRVSFARAILADFQVIILDEPTANVDIETGHKFLGQFAKTLLQDPKRILILITHDTELASLAQRTIHL